MVDSSIQDAGTLENLPREHRPVAPLARKKRPRVAMQDRRDAWLTFIALIVGFGLLFAYVVTDMPGISPAAWRANVVPSHPATAMTGARATFGAASAHELPQPSER